MIEVEHLTKYYGDHAAIQNLNFTIQQGEVVGFLGLNGAGKSTTLKVLGCVLLPTAGKVSIDGLNVADDPHAIRKKIGFLPDLPPLYEEMSVGEYLRFVAELRGVSSKDSPAAVSDAEKKTALTEVDQVLISSLSHGYRQRVGVAQALVHRPTLLILDEPSSGLDPVQIVEMRQLIRSLKGEHTVLVSSHILSEISETCDRLLVIQAGEIVAQGTEKALAQKWGGGGYVELEVRGPAQKSSDVLRSVNGVREVSVLSELAGICTFRVDSSDSLVDVRPMLARSLIEAQIDLLSLQLKTERLESIFLKLIHGQEARP